MSDNLRESMWFAFSLVLAYYTIVLIGVAWDVALLILKSVVSGWILP